MGSYPKYNIKLDFLDISPSYVILVADYIFWVLNSTDKQFNWFNW
jgi:hypothetical protein